MRRFKFTTQLLLLYLGLLLITSILFSLIVIGRTDNISEAQTFDQLESYVTLTEDDWHEGDDVSTEINKVNIASIQGKIILEAGHPNIFKISNLSPNLGHYVNERQLNDILSSVTRSMSPGNSGQGSLSNNGTTEIFYFYSVEPIEEFGSEINFIVAITDSTLAKSLRKNISYQFIGIFSIVITFAFLILGLWGGAYVSRINRLKKHIANLPKTSYKEEYTDPGSDELADLSSSIEIMRGEILSNEGTKQDMLQNISHDFKTPIAVIKSYAEAIQDGMAEKEDAQIIIKQASILQHKVTRLLQYNRLEYLEKREEFTDVSMKEIINDVVNTYRYQTTNIEFVLDLDDTKFKGYQENFYTVIDNLLDNAKRYAKTKVVITLKSGVLSVYNDGEPIDEQFLNGLFKAYEKGANGQFGLGMSIVKKTLDFFEYELAVKNEEVGVKFTIKKKEPKLIYLQ